MGRMTGSGAAAESKTGKNACPTTGRNACATKEVSS
jgi:hypothetical protein